MSSSGYTVVICLCDNNGMTFFGKRQSRDRLLIEDLCANAKSPIYIESYSLPLFEGKEDLVRVVNKIPDDVPAGGLIFSERVSPEPFISDVAGLIIYRWGRKYPADVRFNLDPESVGFSKAYELELVGSSHEKITKGVFER